MVTKKHFSVVPLLVFLIGSATILRAAQWASVLRVQIVEYFLCLLFIFKSVESQNALGWKGPLKVF